MGRAPLLSGSRLAPGRRCGRSSTASPPVCALGIAIGRVGDLVVADHLGKPTRFALGYVCPGTDTASPCIGPAGQAVRQPALCDLLAATTILACSFCCDGAPSPTPSPSRCSYDGVLAAGATGTPE
jgi:hypothetical protein